MSIDYEAACEIREALKEIDATMCLVRDVLEDLPRERVLVAAILAMGQLNTASTSQDRAAVVGEAVRLADSLMREVMSTPHRSRPPAADPESGVNLSEM
jgi:hypothetical protein